MTSQKKDNSPAKPRMLTFYPDKDTAEWYDALRHGEGSKLINELIRRARAVAPAKTDRQQIELDNTIEKVLGLLALNHSAQGAAAANDRFLLSAIVQLRRLVYLLFDRVAEPYLNTPEAKAAISELDSTIDTLQEQLSRERPSIDKAISEAFTGLPAHKEPWQETFWLARHGFFGTAIGDVLKALCGGSGVGAFTLTMCVISALSELEWCTNNQSQIPENGKLVLSSNQKSQLGKLDALIFTEWVERWLKKRINDDYHPAATYAVRCALVHSYGAADATAKAGIDGYLFLTHTPHKHCQIITHDGISIYHLNLEDFVAEVILAADVFLQEMQAKWKTELTMGLENYVKCLIVAKELDAAGKVVPRRDLISLDFFDSRLSESPLKISKSIITRRILELYEKGKQSIIQQSLRTS